jgi:hypothetical protein
MSSAIISSSLGAPHAVLSARITHAAESSVARTGNSLFSRSYARIPYGRLMVVLWMPMLQIMEQEARKREKGGSNIDSIPSTRGPVRPRLVTEAVKKIIA